MSAPAAAAQYAAYRQQSVLTATPAQLVVMLYDGAVRFLRQGAVAMRAGGRRQADERLRRAEAILDELLVTLDVEAGGEVASRLQGVYSFCRRRLLEARREQDADHIDGVARMLEELRGAWAEVATA